MKWMYRFADGIRDAVQFFYQYAILPVIIVVGGNIF